MVKNYSTTQEHYSILFPLGCSQKIVFKCCFGFFFVFFSMFLLFLPFTKLKLFAIFFFHSSTHGTLRLIIYMYFNNQHTLYIQNPDCWKTISKPSLKFFWMKSFNLSLGLKLFLIGVIHFQESQFLMCSASEYPLP